MLGVCGSMRSRQSHPKLRRPGPRAAAAAAAAALGVALSLYALAVDPARAAPAASAAAQEHTTVAQEHTTAPASCTTPQHHQLDFWVGEWQVFDAATHQLVAFDRVEKGAQGCIIQENLTFLTDMYRRPGVAYRLAGIAINRFDGERWLQMWADNQWGAILLSGVLNAEGQMVFQSVIPSRNRDVKLVYEHLADGSVRILQYVAPAGTGRWVKYGDLINRPNR